VVPGVVPVVVPGVAVGGAHSPAGDGSLRLAGGWLFCVGSSLLLG